MTGKQRKRKLNCKKVIELTDLGVIPSDIAREQGVAISTVTRYLKSIEMQAADIKGYTKHKADALCLDQLKSAAVVNIVRDSILNNPDKLLGQDLRLQKEIVVAFQGAKTYDHTSERLERDQSTVNLATIHSDIAAIRAGKTNREGQ